MKLPASTKTESRDITEFDLELLPMSGVRVTHIPSGLSRESKRYPVTSMNLDKAYDELVMELDTNPLL